MALSDYDLHASIAVSDIQQAVAFYEGKLGLPVVQTRSTAVLESDREPARVGLPGMTGHSPVYQRR